MQRISSPRSPPVPDRRLSEPNRRLEPAAESTTETVTQTSTGFYRMKEALPWPCSSSVSRLALKANDTEALLVVTLLLMKTSKK